MEGGEWGAVGGGWGYIVRVEWGGGGWRVESGGWGRVEGKGGIV